MNNTTSRWWDLPAATLLVVAILTAATRLVVTSWTQHLNLIQNLAFFSVILGLALGQSRFSPRLAAFLGIAYGLFAIPWQLGSTYSLRTPWTERLVSLVGRLDLIINQLIRQDVVQDSLLFIVLMSVLFWFLGVYAGYTLTRYGTAWRAILPPGLALFVIHAFDAMISRRAWYLAVYLFFMLVLVARMAYLQQRERWQESRTALPPHLGLDFIRFTLLAAGVIIVFAWTVPALANTVPVAERVFQKIKQPWNEARDRFDNAFASLRSSVGVVSDYYGSSLLLGRGNRLTDMQMFNVKPPTSAPTDVRYYWRARSYDTYSNGGWTSTVGRSQAFDPQIDSYSLAGEQGRFQGTFEFYPATSLMTIFTPSEPLWVSRPASIEARRNPDGSSDISSIQANPALNAGQAYQVVASVNMATVSQLRAAGSDYPAWVRERYLQLPASITQRTRELAINITAGRDTPYDKAIAITNWLRTNIQYSETVPEQPSNQDAVDWFLFTIRSGFCNYYASAEVIMLRSLGIPARWTVGYAQGEKLEDGTYIVRQRDAHAWPEVYFPGLGWIEFEPTASQPVLVRQSGDPNASDAANSSNNSDLEARQREELAQELALLREHQPGGFDPAGASTQPGLVRTVYWVAPLTAGLALLGLLFWRYQPRIRVPGVAIIVEKSLIKVGIKPPRLISQWARLSALPPLTRSYLEINNALRRLGDPPELNATPAERADRLVDKLPDAEKPARRLVNEYQMATFSTQPADLIDELAARQAGADIRGLSFKAMLKRWFNLLLERIQRPERSRLPMQIKPRR